MAPDFASLRVRRTSAPLGPAGAAASRPKLEILGAPPLLGLFGMMRAEDLPERMRNQTWSEPPLIIRARDGSVHPEYSAVKLSFGFPP